MLLVLHVFTVYPSPDLTCWYVGDVVPQVNVSLYKYNCPLECDTRNKCFELGTHLMHVTFVLSMIFCKIQKKIIN